MSNTTVTPVPRKSAGARLLKRLLCCFSTNDPPPAPVDSKDMHSIVTTTQTRQAMSPDEQFTSKPEIQWKSQEEAAKLRETLKLTLRSEVANGFGTLMSSGDGTLENLLRNLSDLDSRDNLRSPMYSMSSERMSTDLQGSSVTRTGESRKVEMSRLKYKDLPNVAQVFSRPSTRSIPSCFPMKPVTPSLYSGKTRIPTARSKMSQILESLQKEDSPEASV